MVLCCILDLYKMYTMEGEVMSVKSQIASILLNALVNVISNDISNGKTGIIERYNFSNFKRKNKKWIDDFCKKNDGTILCSGRFELYLTYQHPINKIFNYVLNPSRDGLGDDIFINQMVKEAKEYLTSGNGNLSVQDESVIKELFKKIYWKLDEYCKKNLSSSERYILAAIINNQAKQTGNIRGDIQDFKELLIGKDSINDPEIIIRIYSTLNDDILSGNIEAVHNILSILTGKNKDLDIAIRIKMSIISDYICLDNDIIEAWSQIKSIFISEDVAKFLILYWIEDKDKLAQMYRKLENQDIREIVQILIDNKRESILNVEIKKENHVDVIKYTVTEQYKKEIWLIRRICAYWLYKQSIFNIYESMKILLESDMTFIDELAIIEKEQETLLSITAIQKIDLIKLNEIKNKLFEIKGKFIHSNPQIKAKFFEILLRSLVILDSNEMEESIQECPLEIRNSIRIKTLIMQYKINKRNVNEKEILDVCEESGQYWLLNNYLIGFNSDTVKLQNIIEQQIKILDKDIGIFMMYIQAIRINKGKEIAIVELDKYRNLYEHYLEYWLEYIKLRDFENGILLKLYDKWEVGELKLINLESEKDFAEILIDQKKHKEAYQVIRKIETLGNTSTALLRLKAKVLLEDNQVINALNILKKIFDEYSDDPFVVDTSIVLSLNSQREIPQKVIDAAIKIGTDRLFMLIAVIYARKKKYSDAKYYITKSLLRSNGHNVDIYGNYFMLNVKAQDGSERKITGVEEDTAVFLDSSTGEKIVYCVYKDDVLPIEPYYWENATHIYRDIAISLGLFRKKTHDTIVITDIEYLITEVMPIECYLFRLCMAKLVETRTIKEFSIETQIDGKINEVKLIENLKEYIPESEKSFDWLNNYKDLSNMPLPFHLLQRNVRVNDVQLIISLMQDSGIIIRELYNVTFNQGDMYILTLASVVMLYMLGVNSQYLNKKNIIISTSLQNTLVDMCMGIIDDNDKDTVSSIGIVEDHLFMNVVSEEEKIRIMREAAELKRFVLELNTQENTSDIIGSSIDKINLIDTFGISDYDALAIAQTTNAVVVTGEVTIMAFLQMKEFGASGMGIINFLHEIRIEISELLDCMEKMEEFEFLITLTKESITYLMEMYTEIEDDDKKEHCMEKWINYLSNPENMSEEYKNIFVQNITDVYKVMYDQQIGNMNPIWSNFVCFLMKYNHIRMEVRFGEDGNIEVITHRVAD